MELQVCHVCCIDGITDLGMNAMLNLLLLCTFLSLRIYGAAIVVNITFFSLYLLFIITLSIQEHYVFCSSMSLHGQQPFI